MNRTDTLLRLKRFRVDEMKRRMASIEAMKGDLEKKLSDLDDNVAREKQRAGDSDIGRLAFLTGQISATGTVSAGLTAITARNGNFYNQLTNAKDQQTSTTTLYKGFIDKIQSTNMADAATQLSLNQTALQASLQVTSTLNRLSLLNFLPNN